MKNRKIRMGMVLNIFTGKSFRIQSMHLFIGIFQKLLYGFPVMIDIRGTTRPSSPEYISSFPSVRYIVFEACARSVSYTHLSVPSQLRVVSVLKSYSISIYSPASALFMLRTAQNLPHILDVYKRQLEACFAQKSM